MRLPNRFHRAGLPLLRRQAAELNDAPKQEAWRAHRRVVVWTSALKPWLTFGVTFGVTFGLTFGLTFGWMKPRPAALRAEALSVAVPVELTLLPRR